MKTHQLHKWTISPEEARSIQKNLCAWVSTQERCQSPSLVARIEFSGSQGDQGSSQSTVTIKSFPSLGFLERKVGIKKSGFPRVPGLISFQKAPSAISALEKLSHTPDLIICDGRGITGPDSFGVASHVGILANLPTIGIRPPKARFNYSTLGEQRGDWLPLADETGNSGVLLRVLDGLDPLLVSPAHKITQEDAIRLLLQFFPSTIPAREYIEILYPESDHDIENAMQPQLKAAGNNNS
ncbi:hypothetical protein A9Q99_27385 [Gammaproteobacteria bacterium 45_16_T64]|nr:hypothetical protein A9Q99_27385 [Gammaproteobacteria bacterium 45_16_T64]